MDRYEKEAQAGGFKYVAGVDEAGRGPLAGPVVAAAVLFRLPLATCLNGLGIDDSKKIKPAKRESLVVDINSLAVSVSIATISAREIDDINILKASLKAMKDAFYSLKPPGATTIDALPVKLLVDGPFALELPTSVEQLAIKKGDSKSVTIAAASIIAKTARDRIMGAYANLFPGYGLLSNKGYGTKEHISALGERGASAIHRKSFKYT